jgi:hypothetical protein
MIRTAKSINPAAKGGIKNGALGGSVPRQRSGAI